MFRSIRPSRVAPATRCLRVRQSPRASLSTVPPAQRSRSLKNSAIRWGLAAGAIYYYNTSNVFADYPAPAETPQDQAAPTPTLESVTAERRRRLAEQRAKGDRAPAISPNPQASTSSSAAAAPAAPAAAASDPATAQELNEEAQGEGAFNPETGEINWDCPCLGGMAHGPCGAEFRAAFSCFVYSEEEPKGVDCIDKFKGMQDCFRQHPDVYGEEIDDDDEEEAGQAPAAEAPSPATSYIGNDVTSPEKPASDASSQPSSPSSSLQNSAQTKPEEPLDESEALVPKAAYDARSANRT